MSTWQNNSMMPAQLWMSKNPKSGPSSWKEAAGLWQHGRRHAVNKPLNWVSIFPSAAISSSLLKMAKGSHGYHLMTQLPPQTMTSLKHVENSGSQIMADYLFPAFHHDSLVWGWSVCRPFCRSHDITVTPLGFLPSLMNMRCLFQL